jgi:hypothetical protein
MLFNVVPVNICSSAYSTPVYVLPEKSQLLIASFMMFFLFDSWDCSHHNASSKIVVVSINSKFIPKIIDGSYL